MNKFKLGDKVTITRKEEPSSYYHIGAFGEIVACPSDNAELRAYEVRFEGGNFTQCGDNTWLVHENDISYTTPPAEKDSKETPIRKKPKTKKGRIHEQT